jgi:endoglucanase
MTSMRRWLLAACLTLPCLALAQAVPDGCRDPQPPLATRGADLVDSRGCVVRLHGVNWFGAESAEFVVGGLDRQPLARIAALIRAGGFNTVRLPWSNELVANNPVVPAEHLAANPELVGLRGLEVLDRVVDALAREGLWVVLDNHRSRADWCCDEPHGDGLWHTPAYPESTWLAHWRAIAQRYRNQPAVIGAELRNEIRPDPSQNLRPRWGGGDTLTDWRAAALRGGAAVLAEAPHWLVIVGGIDYQGHLRGVREQPAALPIANRLVYAAHDYAWTHKPEALRSPAAFDAEAWQRWGHVQTPGQAWTAPVFISEWGGCTARAGEAPSCPADRYQFAQVFARYLCRTGLSHTWWPLNGTQSAGYNRQAGAVEGYGLLTPDWSGWAEPGLVKRLARCYADARR